MSYLSTPTIHIQAITRTITSALLPHLDEVLAVAGPILFPDGVPERVDLHTLTLAVVELLKRDSERLAQLDRAVARERHEDDQARELRDAAARELRETLFVTRNVIQGVFGDEAVRACGLGGRVPDYNEALLSYSRHVVQRLPALQGAPRGMPFVSLNIDKATSELAQRTEALAVALTAVATDVRETQMAQSQRNDAEALWKRHYVVVAGIVEGLLRLAELDHLADRVRPTRRRRSGASEPEDRVETPAPPADGPAAPPADEPAEPVAAAPEPAAAAPALLSIAPETPAA